MKTTKMTSLVSSAVLIAGLAISPAAIASNSPEVAKALAGSTAFELPSKASSLVAKATSTDKQNVAAAAVKEAIGVNASAAIAIVTTVARENPSTAPIVAVTAATLQHKRIDQITKAAVSAAPSEVTQIVAAMIKAFPRDYGTIAVAAAEGAPSAGREILAVVAEHIPALQTYIQNAMAGFAANQGDLPIQAILTQSYSQAVSSSAAGSVVSAPAPTASDSSPSISPVIISAPFTPPTGTIITIGPGQTTNQVPGGRKYSSP
jgi:hypothetical protein